MNVPRIVREFTPRYELHRPHTYPRVLDARRERHSPQTSRQTYYLDLDPATLQLTSKKLTI